MADQRSHVNFSLITAAAYVGFGYSVLGIIPETLLLAAIIVTVTGMLPNIDAADEPLAREMGGLLAAVSPLLLLEYFPSLRAGGVSRIALVIIACYAATRLLFERGIRKFTVHRGMVHSLPAAILCFELTYLLFWDEYRLDRMYLAVAAFLGFFSHLALDAYGNLDLLARATGKAVKKTAVLKLKGPSLGVTAMMYAAVFYFGFLVAKDFYPSLGRISVLSQL